MQNIYLQRAPILIRKDYSGNQFDEPHSKTPYFSLMN